MNRRISNTYDRAENLTNVALPNGLSVAYAYDNADRLTRKTIDGGKYFNYSYDGANNLTGVTDQSSGSYSWDYDGAGRVKYSIDNFGYRLDYQWDKSNNLTAVTGTNTGMVQYLYGSTNRLLSVMLPDGNNISYHYGENGQVFQVRYPGSIKTKNINYSANGWCNIIQDPGFPGNYNCNYFYNNDGTINGISSWAGWDGFSYDALGRLTSWYYGPKTGSPISENYQYDAAGNLLTKGNKTFTYNSANQITNAGFSYDNNGNLTCDGTYMYIYNAEDRLTQVKRVSDNSVVATYAYNFNGLRKSKTVNGQTTNYSWDEAGNLVRESDMNGNTLASYYYDASGNLVGMKKNNQTYIYHNNLRGDIVSITDYNGNIQAQYHYDPWGTQISNSGTLTQPFRYAGYYYDDETGLCYLKSRYYSPALGRFLTKDAYGFIDYKDGQTLNLYAYCGNNPVNFSDPDGNCWFLVGAAIGAGIGMVASAVTQYATTGNIDGKKLLIDTAAGALSGALASTGVGIGLAIAGNAAISAGASVANNVASGNKVTLKGTLTDAAIGGIAGAAGGAGAQRAVKSASGVIIKSLSPAISTKVVPVSTSTATKIVQKEVTKGAVKSGITSVGASIGYNRTGN